MQPILDHLANVVRPALRDYAAAERALSAAHASKDAGAIEVARIHVMRMARTAATELNHLTDFVLHNPCPPASFTKIEDIRDALRAACVFVRGPVQADDTDLLQDTAEAFKHFVLSRPSATVSGAEAIVTLGSGWGEMRYGEGKYGGGEQVLVVRKNGEKSALSAVTQNTFDAWLRVLGQPLPPVGDY